MVALIYLASSLLSLSMPESFARSSDSCCCFNSSYECVRVEFCSSLKDSWRFSALISSADTTFADSSAYSRLVHFSCIIRTFSVSVRSVLITREKSAQTYYIRVSRVALCDSNSRRSRSGFAKNSSLSCSTSNLTVIRSSIFFVF